MKLLAPVLSCRHATVLVRGNPLIEACKTDEARDVLGGHERLSRITENREFLVLIDGARDDSVLSYVDLYSGAFDPKLRG